MAKEIFDDEVLIGREGQPWAGAQDGRFAGGKFQCRGIQVHEIGNPGQINIARIGPDNVNFNHFPPAPVLQNQTLGHISFSGYLGTDLGLSERCAQIHSRYVANGRGTLTLSTSLQDRITIDENGTLDLTGCQSSDGKVHIKIGDREVVL